MKQVFKPKYLIGDSIVGVCHPASNKYVMVKVSGAYYNDYGHWVYTDDKKNEMVEWDVIHRFKA